jgi:uncharacterized membrane protein
MTQSIRMNLKSLAIVAGVMLVIAGSIANLNDASATKYESSQANAGSNDCGNGVLPQNIFCQNLASQIDGDGNAINIIALQPASGEVDDGLQLLP